MKKNLYNRLGVKKTATKSQIKKAFRKVAKKKHPDKGGNNEEFSSICEAYTILINDTRRGRYDKTGDINLTPEEERIKSAAITKLAEMLNRLFDENDEEKLFYYDIIDFLKDRVKLHRDKINDGIVEVESKKKLPTEIMKRLKCSNKSGDILASIIEDRIRNINKAVENLKFEVKVCGKMIEILDFYKFMKKVRRPVVNASTTTATSFDGFRVIFGNWA